MYNHRGGVREWGKGGKRTKEYLCVSTEVDTGFVFLRRHCTQGRISTQDEHL